MPMEAATKQQIEDLIQKNRVMLFMKGSKSFPQCGFSSAVVSILKEVGVSFETANVLADAGLREGIKEFSDWPTIPQLYVDGQFVGGCDIVREMHANGELQKVLGVKVEPPKTPTITLSDAAAKAFLDATEPGEDRLRLEIDSTFRVDLYFAPAKTGDLKVTANGVEILVDPSSARRADGVSIDYIEGPDGAGFKVENPNAPATVKQISAKELEKMLAAEEKVHLFDVRTDKERATAKIERATFLDAAGKEALEALPKDALVVFHCHHGGRSQAAADHYLKQGFKRVFNLAGGIDAWSRDVDSKIPRY
jgi:monothiol glutaredoxin